MDVKRHWARRGLVLAVTGLTWFSCEAFAQLATDQRLSDFRALADTFAKYYAPYEWKRDALKFDALQIGPWLARVQETQRALGFYGLMAKYEASLNDAHDAYYLPSDPVREVSFAKAEAD